MEDPKFNISGTELNQKKENEGVDRHGRLSAAEFNLLVNAVIESQEKVATLEDYFIPISESDYEKLVASGELKDRPYFIYEN